MPAPIRSILNLVAASRPGNKSVIAILGLPLIPGQTDSQVDLSGKHGSACVSFWMERAYS